MPDGHALQPVTKGLVCDRRRKGRPVFNVALPAQQMGWDMTVVLLVIFVGLAAAALWLVLQDLAFLGFACAALSCVPLLLAANQQGAAIASVAILGPIAALGIILDTLRRSH